MELNPVIIAIAKRYTDKKITEAGSVVIDPTLTKEGQAADAKSVGDKLRNIDLLITDDGDGNVSISCKGA